MKKVLLGTSAIALLGAAATPASAAEWDLRWGGFMTQQFGFASTDIDIANEEVDDDLADFDGVDVLSDAEIIFRPSITLDNGIQFGLQVQLEGNTSGDQIDESFLFVDGSFGRVLLGSENSAGYLMTVIAPTVSVNGHSSGSITSFVPYSGGITLADGTDVEVGDNVFRGTLGTTLLENVGSANNDSQRLTYFTPRFFGLQGGFSYARDFEQDDSAQVNLAGAYGDIIDIGLNYTNSFGGIDVAASGRWGIVATTPDDDDPTTINQDETESPMVYGFGLNVGFAGVTVGGSFAEQNNAPGEDGTSWDVGIAYETGPWGFSFSYFNGENQDNEFLTSADPVLASATEEVDLFVVGVNYALAQGVDLNLFGAYVDFDEEFTSTDIGTISAGDPGGDDVDGFVVAGAIALSF
ncbi:MAG: porin [Pseudomonadota bacterium]